LVVWSSEWQIRDVSIQLHSETFPFFSHDYLIAFQDLIPDERNSNSDSDEPVDIPGQQPRTVRALHNFCSKDPQDLAFDKGDIINVVDSSDPHLWKGELDGAVGMFHRTYCEVISTETPDSMDEALDKETPPPMYSEPAVTEDFQADAWPATVSDSKTPTSPRLSPFLPHTNPKDVQPTTPKPQETPLASMIPEEPTSRSNLALLTDIKVASSQKKLKDWLHMASALRKEGNQYKTEGKLQAAFVYLKRSATCILEKIPNHPSYDELNATQKAMLVKVCI
jgi:hypothetical protein